MTGRRMAPTPKRTALVVVDMQNAFCRDDGSMDGLGLDVAMLKAAVDPCARLVAAARGAGVPVIFTRYVYRPDYADGGILVKYLMPALGEADRLAAGTRDIEVVDELAPRPGEHVIDKNRPSSFHGTELERILTRQGIDSLVVCGVTTNCCLETTVRDASQRDYKTFVVADATGELERQRHDFALASMDFLFADVVCVEEVLSLWAPVVASASALIDA